MFLKYIWLIMICPDNISSDIIPDKVCLSKEYPDIRTFHNLSDFKSNKISFDYHSSAFQGHNVAFEDTEITRLPTNAFVTYTSDDIIQLNLSHKSINVIESRAFKSLICLKNLDLSYNKIVNLSREQFVDLMSLTTLDLSKNSIRKLFHFTFKHMTNLIYLDLSHNDIGNKIEDLTFYFLVKLERLGLSHNNMRTFTNYYAFDHLLSLKFLDFSYCSIAIFNVRWFLPLQNLEILDVSGNKIVFFYTKEARRQFNNVIFLNLSDNYLLHLNVGDLRRVFPNQHLVVDINDNAFYCSDLENVLERLHQHKIIVSYGRDYEAEQQRNSIICDTVNATHNLSANDYYSDFVTTSTTTETPITILDTYRSEVTRHKVKVVMLSIILCIAAVYDIFIVVDYFMDFGIMRRVFRRRQQRIVEASEPEENVPLQN